MLVVDEHAATLRRDDRSLLAARARLAHACRHDRSLRARLHDRRETFGAEALGRGNEVDRLEQARLALTVVTDDDVRTRRRIEVDGVDVSEVPDRNVFEAEGGERPHVVAGRRQMRIGMITAR